MDLIQIVLLILIILVLLVSLVFFLIRKYSPKELIVEPIVNDSEEYTVEYHKEGLPYLIKKDKDGNVLDTPFKVLSTTDLHVYDDPSFSLSLLSKLIDYEKPDLVVLDGDNACGRVDDIAQKKIIKFFEERKLHYGFVLGNHDAERKFLDDFEGKELTDEEKSKIDQEARHYAFSLLSKSEYCVSFDTQDVFGAGNSFVNIKNSKGIVETIFFLDSGDYIFGKKRKRIWGDKRCYSCLRESELEWVKETIRNIQKENSGYVPKSIAFFHIPLLEHEKAYRRSILGIGSKLIYGNNYERPCYSDVKNNSFEILKSANVECIVCGHDHKNDSCILYKGVVLMYSQPMSYNGAYNRRKYNKFLKFLYDKGSNVYTDGASIFNIGEDGMNIYPRYLESIGAYEGLDEYLDKSFFGNTYIKGKDERL